MTARRRILSLIVLLTAVGGCWKDPDRTKRAYLESGNQYYGHQKYSEAIVEYRKAIEADPGFVDAHRKLAEALVSADDAEGAVREYVKVADLSPGDVHSQIKAGQLLLKTRLHVDAAGRAAAALQIEPNNIEALILLANATAGLPDLETAVDSLANVSAIKLKEGNREEAEAAFKNAVSIQPNSADVRVALATFEWASGRTVEAEAGFRRALALSPRHLLANRALAVLCATTGRLPEAERYLKTAAEVSSQSKDQLSLAEYYLQTHRYDAATPLLAALGSDKTMGIDARLRLAAIERVQGRTGEAGRIADDILATRPHHTDALLLKAQVLLDEHKSDQALACLKLAAESDPRSDAAQFALGKLYAGNHRPSEAASAFQEAIRLNPDVAAYSLEMAKIDLTRGDVDASLRHATEAASNAPNDPDVQLMLARGFIAKRSLKQAEAMLKPLLAAQPKSATVQAELGALRFLQGNRAGARNAFEEAVKLDPSADEALSALIQMDISDRRPQQAVARAEANLARRPNDIGAMLTAAGTYVLANESLKAEGLLLKVIEVAPSTFKAYSLLGKMYVAAGKLDQARTLFEGLSRRTPPVVGAYVMVGLVLEAQRKLPEAKSWYERALKVDPNAAVAANNLAWLELTTGGDLESALQLARSAKAQLPSEPIVSDTLGWIYYAKGSPELGIQMLQLCVDTDPKNATYRYHLGMLYAKAKDWPKAKDQLKLALSLDPSFEGAAEAKLTLASAPAK